MASLANAQSTKDHSIHDIKSKRMHSDQWRIHPLLNMLNSFDELANDQSYRLVKGQSKSDIVDIVALCSLLLIFKAFA